MEGHPLVLRLSLLERSPFWRSRFAVFAALQLVLVGSGCGEQAQAPRQTTLDEPRAEFDRPRPTSMSTLEFVDIAGETHRPLGDPQVRAALLVFLVPDCPIANSYAPELNRLQAEYDSRGVRIFLIQVDPALSLEAAREHAEQYQLQAPVVWDPRQEWVKKLGATKTPEAVIVSPTGSVLYQGRIDDRFVGLGKRRAQVTSHDLRDALEAMLSGSPVMETRTVVVGCEIPLLTTGSDVDETH